jgi:hypothetical protein
MQSESVFARCTMCFQRLETCKQARSDYRNCCALLPLILLTDSSGKDLCRCYFTLHNAPEGQNSFTRNQSKVINCDGTSILQAHYAYLLS